jgi:hypothetical protein
VGVVGYCYSDHSIRVTSITNIKGIMLGKPERLFIVVSLLKGTEKI